ncbi:MAG TPA: PP0621 family protein [Candidatus Azoamicus sp.]
MIGLIKGFIYMVFVILIAQAIGVIYNFIIFYFRKKNIKSSNTSSNSEVSLNMLQCEKCKLYVTKSEAYIINGKVFCKKEHSE